MASMQRSWQRQWARSKPIWQSAARFYIQRQPKKKKSGKVYSLVERNKKMAKKAVASVAATLLLGCFGIDIASASSNISIDGNTATHIVTQDNITNIHTDTFKGQNGLNSFHEFNVTKGDTVNLHFSNSTNTYTATNLLNFVTGGNMSYIDGTLNGIKNGKIGGNVYFLNPQGIMVGASGVINVGSLTMMTPTKSFVDGFFDGLSDSQTATDAILNRTIPIDSSGLIVVQGKVNAIKDIGIFAGNVTNKGTIMSGAMFTNKEADFSDIVNVNNLQSGTRISVENGNIVIMASTDIKNSGIIAADGAQGLNAGSIMLEAGRDISLDNGSLISAKGYGENSSGGLVHSYAQNNGAFNKGAVIDVSSSTSGDAGSIEFSAKEKVTLSGGNFKASAVKGKAGNILIDPNDIEIVSSNQILNGANYTLIANDSITVGSDVTISTRNIGAGTDYLNALSQGDSGNLTLTAHNINIDHGAKLLAHANNGKTGGAVTLNAINTADINILGYKSASATINVGDSTGGATITGDSVTMHAAANADHSYIIPSVDANGNALDLNLANMGTGTLSTVVQELGAIAGVQIVYSQSQADATINVKNGSVIRADKGVDIKAETVTGAGSRPIIPIPLKVGTPLAAGVMYASIDAKANVNVESGATITAKDLTVTAHNNATMDGSITAKPKITANSSGQVVSVAVGVTNTDVESGANVAGTLNVSGNVQVVATNEGSYSTSVTVATPPDGVAAGGVAIALRNTKATATLTGNVTDAAKVGVYAVNDITKDETKTSVTSGTSTLSDITNQLVTNVTDKATGTLASILHIDALQPDKITQTAATQQKFRIAGAITYVDSDDKASAIIGGGGTLQTIHATDFVAVGSQVKIANTNITADVATKSNSSTGASSGNISHNSYAVGLTIGNNDHDSLAKIGSNVTITAPKIGVASQTITPIRDNIFTTPLDDSTTLSTITSVAEGLIDTASIFNGGSTARAASDGSSGSMDLSGSISILEFSNTSQGIIDTGAKLNLTGNATGSWDTDNVTVNAGSDAQKVTILGKDITYKSKVDPKSVKFSFDKQADIKAANDTTLLFLGGPIIPTGGGEKGAGMTLNDVTVNSTVNAIVREGVVIQGVSETADTAAPGSRTWTQSSTGLAPELEIKSDNKDKVISIVATAGAGGTFGMDGSIAITNLNEQSYAWIDDEATIKVKDLDVNATIAPVLWSIAGGVNYSSGASVGVGVAVNTVDTDTKAAISDNDTVSTDENPRVSASTVTDAKIVAPMVDVAAHTGGNIGAVAVTAAIANSSDDKTPGALDKLKDKYKSVQDKAAMMVGLSQNPVTKGGKLLAQPESPTIGLSGAGSASVNSTSMENAAVIDHVTIDQKPIGYTGNSSLTVRATANPYILATSGAAAVTRANSSSQSTKVGVTGSVAINMVGNGNSATLSNTTVTGADDVAVQALSSGEQVAVAIGMHADVSKQGADSTFSANGSVSLTLDKTDSNGNTKNVTKALIEDATITGTSGHTGRAVDVTAYNSTAVGTGGGALEIQPLSSDATGAGVGAAVTFADVRRDVSSKVVHSAITQVDDIGVGAFSSSKITAAGGVGSVTNDANTVALAGAVVISEVTNHTTASVDSGSKLTATDSVIVTAQNKGKVDSLESLIDNRTRTENLNYNAMGNLSGGSDGIVAVAGVVQANLSSGSNVGASVTYSQISDTLLAQVVDSEVTTTGAAGTISVKAASDANILGLAVGAGASKGGFSGAGSIAMSVIDNSITAFVGQSATGGSATTLTANTVTVDAADNSKIQTIGGQVNLSIGSSAAVGAAVTYNEISNIVSAKVDKAAIAASKVTVAGHNSSKIDSIAAAGAITTDGPAAVAGSITVNLIDNTTEGQVLNGSVITGDGSSTSAVNVGSTDKSKIQSLAGSLAASGGKAAVGGAFAYNEIGNKNIAKVDSSTVVNTSAFSLTATEDATINTLSAAVGGAQNVAISGSVSISTIGNETVAQLNQATLSGNTGVTIKGTDSSEINSLAGAGAFSGGTSIGGSIAVNTTTNSASATVTGSTLNNINQLILGADNSSIIRSLSVSGSGGADFAFAGSSSANTIHNQTKAGIVSSSITNPAAAVDVTALNTGRIEALSGGAAVSGSVGVGLAVSVNRIGNTTEAYVDGSAVGTKYDIGNLKVNAIGENTIKSAAVGVGGGADVGVAGSTATNYNSSNTKAYITNGAVVKAQNNVGIIAKTDDKITNLAGAAGIGISAAGVGASVTVNVISGDTQAYISGAGTKVSALATGDAQTVDNGKLTGSVDLAKGLDIAKYGRTDLEAMRGSTAVHGVAVNATATHSVENLVANVGGGLYAGVAGTANVSVIKGNTEAYIDGASINSSSLGTGAAQQAISVIAGDHAYSNGFAGTLAVGPLGAGVGIGVDTNVFSGNTKAYIQNSGVQAVGGIKVDAQSTQGASSLVTSGAGGIVGVVGTGSVGIFNGSTEAYLQGDTVANAESLIVNADHNSRFAIAAGGVTIGGEALAATFAVASDSNTTKAHIDDSAVNATGAINVEAKNTSQINNWGVSGALGGADGVAGNAVVSLVNNTSQAYVTGSHLGTAGSKAASVTVKATDIVTVDNKAGSLGVGISGYGVGAGASVIEVGDTTTAYIGNSDVHTIGGTTVDAQAERTLNNTAVSVGIGGTAGISGTAAVTLVGKELSGDVKSSELDKGGKGTLTQINDLTSGNRLTAGDNVNTGSSAQPGVASGISASEMADVNSAAKLSVTTKLSNSGLSYRTAALVSGNSVIDAGGKVQITASEKDKISMLTGGLAVGGVGVGGSVGVLSINNNVEASVLDAVQITAGAAGIDIKATAGKLSGSDPAASVKTYQGSAGLVALGAAVAIVDVSNNVTAKAARGTTLTTSAGTVDMQAADNMDVNAEAQGYSAGVAAAGVVVSNVKKSGDTKVLIGDSDATGAATTITGAVTLKSERTGSVSAFTRAGAGGVYAGSGSASQATDSGSSKAKIGNQVIVNAAGHAVAVTANAAPQVSARAEGFGGALYASVGGAVAKANAATTVEASVGADSRITADALAVDANAMLNGANPSAKSYAQAVGVGGLLGLNAAVSQAENSTTVIADIGSNTNLQIGTSLAVTADNTTNQTAEVTGVVGGAAAIGASVVTATSNSNTFAYLADHVTVNNSNTARPDVSVTAHSSDINIANAKAGVGGVIAGSAAVAETKTGGTTQAYIGANSELAADEVEVDAEHNAQFNATIDSTSASLLGASGAVVKHTVNSTVQADIGQNAHLSTTGNVALHATNTSTKGWLNGAGNGDNAGWNISAASGGLLNGAAVSNTTTVNHTTAASVGDGAEIVVGTDPGKIASFKADADSMITVHDKAKINSGGAIAIALVDSRINATSNTDVVFGEAAQVHSKKGTIKAGTKGSADLDNRVAVDTYGLAGAPAGKAYSNYDGNNYVNIKKDAQLTTDIGDITLAAGRDTAGYKGIINANAVVNLWNKTVVPINTKPDPQANIANSSTIDINKDSYVGSGQDIYLTTDQGKMGATYTGVGKDLYREALAEIGSAISKLFGGGEVNLDIKGGSSSVRGATRVNVDGKVETGIKRAQSMTIDGEYKTEGTGADATKTWKSNNIQTTDGVTYTVQRAKEIGSGMTDRLTELYALKGKYAGDTVACAAYDAEILFLQNKMVAMGLASWDTTGAKPVFVPGSNAGKDAVSPRTAVINAKEEMIASQATLVPKIEAQDQAVTAEKVKVQPVVDLVTARNTAQVTLSSNEATLNTAKTMLTASLPTGTTAPGSTAAAQTAYDKAVADKSSIVNQYKAVLDAYTAVDTTQGTITSYKEQIVTKGYAGNVTLSTVNAPVDVEQGKLEILNNQKSSIEGALAGLTDAYINSLSNEIPKGPTTDFITVDDVTAKLGNIHVKADNLSGTGSLNAPGDASISITNNSPNFLTVKNLKIRDGGDILFNGALVRSKAEINAMNSNGSGANFTEVKTTKNTPLPTITVDSTFNPDANKFEIVHKNSSGGEVHTGVYASLDIAPDITLKQDSEISNIKGKVTIHSSVGSIYANGSINAGTVDINASNGDFVQRYVNGFDHIGGNPTTIDSGTTTPGGITANGNIFVSARYLNINGLIQSGIAEWTLNLSDDSKVLIGGAEKTLAEATAHYKANGGVGKYKLAGSYGNISKEGYVLYDAVNDRFDVVGVEVHGGYVQLFGQIMNTAKEGAATGKVRALDGYGTITIHNASSKDIVINKLDAGSGNAGIIDITDVQNDAGDAIHTVYTSNKGVLTKTVNDVQVDSSYTTKDGRPVTTYDSHSDIYYNWTTGTDASKTEKYHFESNDVFGFEYSNRTVGTLTSLTYGQTTLLPDGNYLTNGFRPYGSTAADGYYSSAAKSYNAGATEYTKIREWTKRKWYTLGIAGTYYLDYQLVTPTKIITTNTVKASNPVGIEFFGSNGGTVNITSSNANSNVLLNGSINNKEGSTSINVQNNILQQNDGALITTKTLQLTAGNDIGSSAEAVRTIASEKLSASAANGNVNVAQILGNLSLGNVTADHGTVTLSADGNITNAPGASTVRGKRVELTSTNGTLGGDENSPLIVETGFADLTNATIADKVKYGLKASAMGNINIENRKWTGGGNAEGNLLIDAVTSTAGDVKLTTPGQMIDNNINEQIDQRTWDQLTNYWDSIQLRAGETTNAEKQEQTITSYAGGKTADYQTYWQLKAHIVNGAYVCTDAEKAALSAQNVDADAFAASQKLKYQQLETEGVSSWSGGAYDASFVYTVSEAEKKQLLKGSSWTDRELAISISPGALKELTDTNPIIKEPNVKGKNVTLAAGKGIGSNVSLAGIDASILPQNLTPEQKVALAAAERADLAIDNIGNIITITQRKPVNIEAVGGVLNATAGTYAYLGSEKTVLLDQITAGAGYDVRLKVGGSILNGDTSNYNVTGQNVILEAANGSIGTKNAALRLNNDGTLTARAAEDIIVEKDGDIQVDTIYSEKDVNLTAAGTIQTAYPTDQVSIMSRSLTLKSNKVGGKDKALGISLADDGQLSVDTGSDIYLKNVSNTLTISDAMSNSGDIDITASQNMIANHIKANIGSIKLNAAVDLTADHVETPGVINLISGQNMTAANIKSSVDDIRFIAGRDMAVSGIESATKTVALTTGGNLTVDRVKAAADQNITIKAQGDILNGASDSSVINLAAQNIDLLSETGNIGQNNNHVTVDAAGAVTAAAQKDINITSKGTFTADRLSSAEGYVNITVADNSNLHILDTQVNKGMNLRGSKVALDQVVHTGDSMLTMDISGVNETMADQVTVNVTSPKGVQFNNLKADQATIKGNTNRLDMRNTLTGTRAEMSNNYYTVVADNNPPQSIAGSHVLLRPLDSYYDLSIDGKKVFTNTTVVNSQGGILVNGSATQDNAITIADKTINPPPVTGGGELGAAGMLVRNNEFFMGSLRNPANLVDITELMNSQTDEGMSNDDDEEVEVLK